MQPRQRVKIIGGTFHLGQYGTLFLDDQLHPLHRYSWVEIDNVGPDWVYNNNLELLDDFTEWALELNSASSSI